jgi:hypothetical protein
MPKIGNRDPLLTLLFRIEQQYLPCFELLRRHFPYLVQPSLYADKHRLRLAIFPCTIESSEVEGISCPGNSFKGILFRFEAPVGQDLERFQRKILPSERTVLRDNDLIIEEVNRPGFSGDSVL